MQKSETPTEYVIIKAYTNSEWDSCGFAIIHVSDEWRTTMQKRFEAIEPFKEDYTFYNHSYRDAPEGFYETPD